MSMIPATQVRMPLHHVILLTSYFRIINKKKGVEINTFVKSEGKLKKQLSLFIILNVTLKHSDYSMSPKLSSQLLLNS